MSAYKTGRENSLPRHIDEIPGRKQVSISVHKNKNKDFVFNTVDPGQRQKINLFEVSPTRSG